MTFVPRSGVVVSLALTLPAALYACSSGGPGGASGSDSGSHADGGKTATKDGAPADGAKDAKKDGEGGGIKGKPQPQEGGNIPDVSIDALKHHGDAHADGGSSDATTDGSHSGDSGQPGGDASMGDAGPKGCTYTVTGGAAGAGTCVAEAALGSGKLSFTLNSTTGDNPLVFAATLGSTGPLMTGTYTQASTSFSAGTFQEPAEDMSAPPMGSYALCYRPGNPCTGWAMSGPAPTFNDVGTFALTINSTGPSFAGVLWSDACGTLTADYPAQLGTTSPGSAQITATFCGVATPDASAPDAASDGKAKDGSTASGACKMTLSGPVSGVVACKVGVEQYVTADNTTALSITGTPPDGGSLASFSEVLAVTLPGQLTATTYTTATSSVVTLCTGATSCNVSSSVGTSGANWSESWSPTGGSMNGGTWQVQINQLGAQDPNPAGFSYIGLHGVYTGTLSIDTGSATGVEDITVSF